MNASGETRKGFPLTLPLPCDMRGCEQQNLWVITKEEDTFWYLPLLLFCRRGVEVYTPLRGKSPTRHQKSLQCGLQGFLFSFEIRFVSNALVTATVLHRVRTLSSYYRDADEATRYDSSASLSAYSRGSSSCGVSVMRHASGLVSRRTSARSCGTCCTASTHRRASSSRPACR